MKKKIEGKEYTSFKKLFMTYPITIPAAVVCITLSLIMLMYNKTVAVVGLILTALIVIISVVLRLISFKNMETAVNLFNSKVNIGQDGEGLNEFPLPVVIFNDEDKIIWYNIKFNKHFLSSGIHEGADVKQFTSGQGTNALREAEYIECAYSNRNYTAFPSVISHNGKRFQGLYFVDDTVLKKYKAAYLATRPVFMIINLDSIEDTLRDFRESQQSEILGDVEAIIENWFVQYNCILRKTNNNRFVVFAEKEKLIKMMENKFSVLSQVREFTYDDTTLGLTLSIGVGLADGLLECETIARQALDMAMGRGGDHVAIKPKDGEYEFFGGVSKGVEKRNKTRTRMIASAIMQTINNCDNLLVMGHRFADLDALGSAVGVAMIGFALGKDSRIVMSSKTTLATPLSQYLKENGMGDIIIEPENVDDYLTDNTLLVIVDTHRQSFLESPELYDKVDKVVVIDHHRKTVDHINKSVLFYHEPYASSASEMVTELIQYINVRVNVPKACAEALLSGIMLDTKNFVMKTGVRTFEAAAYLRSLGADTVAVKQLFANSMRTEKAKSEIVRNSKMYKNCAIGIADFEIEDIRIVASQAADELLNINGVSASFVLFRTGETINISARSYGDINVQVVMEQLGGGGHQTMAATQLNGEKIENAFMRLKFAIDKMC